MDSCPVLPLCEVFVTGCSVSSILNRKFSVAQQFPGFLTHQSAVGSEDLCAEFEKTAATCLGG